MSHRTSRIASMSARAAFVGEQMLACTRSCTHCGCVRTCTPSAPSSTSVKFLTPPGLWRRLWVTGGMWLTVANFLCGTLSHVRVCEDVSPPWFDNCIAQGRVLSPLLFNPFGQQPCSRHPTRFTWCPTRSTLRSVFHASTTR